MKCSWLICFAKRFCFYFIFFVLGDRIGTDSAYLASRNDGTGLDCITYDMRFPMLYSHVIIYIPTGPLTVIVIIRSHLCYFCQSSYNFSIIHDFKSVTMLGIVPFLFIGNTQCIIVFKCNFFSIFFILF